MANSYHQIYIQAVFAVKHREAIISPSFENNLYSVVSSLINESGCNTILVNGTENHIHCFFKLKPTIAISKLMQVVKSNSSRFINENSFTARRFEWQDGYGAFGYGHSQVSDVYQYIKNQKLHHQKILFIDEYQACDAKYHPDHLVQGKTVPVE